MDIMVENITGKILQGVIIGGLLAILVAGIYFSYEEVRYSPIGEEIAGTEWTEDSIYLTQNTLTKNFLCFGCEGDFCLYPSSLMQEVSESEDRYCAGNFRVVSVSVDNFEECVADGYSVSNSAPRRCSVGGDIFYEETRWYNDGIAMVRNLDSGSYECVGCNANTCVFPSTDNVDAVQESVSLHCDLEFVVVEG